MCALLSFLVLTAQRLPHTSLQLSTHSWDVDLPALFAHNSVFAFIKVFGLDRSSLPGGLQSSVEPPAELLCASSPAFVLSLNLNGRDFLCCLAEWHWKGWLASGNTLGIIAKLDFLVANFPHTSICPALWFQLFDLFLRPFLIQYWWLFYSNCGENKSGVRRAGWWMGKKLGLQVPGPTLCVCMCVYMLQHRGEKPEVSFSTGCNPIRRITLLSQAIWSW